MGRGRRTRRRARRKSFKDPKPLILVVTEGEVTEPKYLDGFVRDAKNPRVDIRVVGIGSDPRTIVDTAKSLNTEAKKQARRAGDPSLGYDQVWCVFDIDEHLNVENTKQMARHNGFELAVSNPCFELWLFLHFAEQPGQQHRYDLQRRMKKHIPNFDKHVDYADYTDGYQEAVSRATRLDAAAQAVGEEGRNPTTGLWRLTESIRSDA